jgi:transposase
MNTINTPIAQEVKLAIAVEFVKAQTKPAALAVQFGVSESTVRRAIKTLEAEAKAVIAQEQAPKKAKRASKAEVIPTGPKGYKGRNGRWGVLNVMFAKHEEYATRAELYEAVNKECVAVGLTKLNKNSFHAMFSIWKRSQAV